MAWNKVNDKTQVEICKSSMIQEQEMAEQASQDMKWQDMQYQAPT